MDVFERARRKFPLPAEEEQQLTQILLASILLTTLAAIIVSVILECLEGMELLQAATGGWAAGVAEALKADWPSSLAVGVALAALMLAVNHLVEKAALRTEKGRAAVAEVRRGINGEMARLPLWKVAALMVGVGCAEETAFRYALIGVFMAPGVEVLGFPAAAVLAVGASTLVFTLMHTQYHDPYATGTVAALGVILGTAYVLTGALTAVIVAHALYDFTLMTKEARRMVQDPDYFGAGGEAPVNAVQEEYNRLRKGKGE